VSDATTRGRAQAALTAGWWIGLGFAGAAGGAIYGLLITGDSLTDLFSLRGGLAAAATGALWAIPPWLLLASRGERVAWWVPFSAVAMVLGAMASIVGVLLSLVVPGATSLPLTPFAAAGAVLGAFVAIAQSLLLRGRSGRGRLIWVSAVSGSVFSISTVAFGPVGGAAAGVAYQLLVVLVLTSMPLRGSQDNRADGWRWLILRDWTPVRLGLPLALVGAGVGTWLAPLVVQTLQSSQPLPIDVQERFVAAPDDEAWTQPVWVASTDEIFFISTPRSSRNRVQTDLLAVRPDGSGLRRVPVADDPVCSQGSFENSVTPLADGRLGLLEQCRIAPEGQALLAYDPRTGGFEQLVPYRLASNMGPFAVPPDGSPPLIVQPDSAPNTGSFEVLMRLTPHGPERVQPPYSCNDLNPSFSPDGSVLALVGPSRTLGRFDRCDNTGRRAIYLARPDSSHARLLADGFNRPGPMSWSPDGRWLLVSSGGEPQTMQRLVEVATGKQYELPTQWGNATWAPGGPAIAVSVGTDDGFRPPEAFGLKILDMPDLDSLLSSAKSPTSNT
jgi:WD40-like Beta Propeller Repeat